MAWINVIEPKDATGELKKLYNHVTGGDDSVEVDNILTIHSLHPKTLEAHLMLYEELMHGENNLTKKQREMISVVVSEVNKCTYWVTHHSEGLRKASDDDFMEQIRADYMKAEISNKEKLMLKYAEKLTKEPWNMVEQDVIYLRKAGFEDVDILDINQIVAYYAYVNRLADGLGVSLEGFWNK